MCFRVVLALVCSLFISKGMAEPIHDAVIAGDVSEVERLIVYADVVGYLGERGMVELVGLKVAT